MTDKKDYFNPWKGLKGLPHNMWILFVSTLINRSGTMALPFLALYITKQLNLSEANAGLILASYGAGALVSSPFIGRICDRLGAMRIMRLSLLYTGLLLFVYPLITDFILVLIFTFIWSIINEAFRPANMSLISEVVSGPQRRTAFALNRLAINLGMSIGPVVGGLLTLINFSVIFYVDGITSISAAIFLMLAGWEKSGERSELSISTGGNDIKKLSVLKDRNFIYFLLAMVPVEIVFFQTMSTLPLFMVHDLGLSAATYGSLIVINTGLIIFLEVPLNNYLTSWPDRKNLTVGALLTGLGFGGMVFASNIIHISITIIIWTFGEMIIFPASAAYISENSPISQRGEFMGIFQMTNSFSFMFGPWLGTFVMENYGSFTLWSGTFIFSIFSAILMFKLKNKPRDFPVSYG